MTREPDFRYLKLTDTLSELIENGTYKVGSKLPSERDLCQDYGLSRTTVRQALQELSQKGYVTSAQGKGTFVSRPPIKQELLTIYSFDEDMRRLGKEPQTEVLDFLSLAATEKLAAMFEIPIGATVYRVIRLRAADGEPMLLETNFLPANRFEGISEEMIKGQSLYSLLVSKFSLKLTCAEETFAPVLLNYMEAKMLGTSINALGMLVERVSYEGEKMVEYSKSVSPGEKFNYHVILKNNL